MTDCCFCACLAALAGWPGHRLPLAGLRWPQLSQKSSSLTACLRLHALRAVEWYYMGRIKYIDQDNDQAILSSYDMTAVTGNYEFVADKKNKCAAFLFLLNLTKATLYFFFLFWVLMYRILLPRMKASPYFACWAKISWKNSCPRVHNTWTHLQLPLHVFFCLFECNIHIACDATI